VNHARMTARWKLGRALAKVERAQGARSDKATSSTGLTKLLKQLALSKQTRGQPQKAVPQPAFREPQRDRRSPQDRPRALPRCLAPSEPADSPTPRSCEPWRAFPPGCPRAIVVRVPRGLAILTTFATTAALPKD
jgi:hypothetical protein